MESMDFKKTGSKKRIIWIVLFLLIAAAGVIGYKRMTQQAPSRVESEFKAKYGVLDNKSPEELKALLDKTVQEGMINIVIDSNPVFDAKTMKGKINIENIEANHYYEKVTITLDDTKEVLAESDMIKPGQYVDEITLGKKLEPGNYKATAEFITYYPDENEDALSKTNFALTIRVQ